MVGHGRLRPEQNLYPVPSSRVPMPNVDIGAPGERERIRISVGEAAAERRRQSAGAKGVEREHKEVQDGQVKVITGAAVQVVGIRHEKRVANGGSASRHAPAGEERGADRIACGRRVLAHEVAIGLSPRLRLRLRLRSVQIEGTGIELQVCGLRLRQPRPDLGEGRSKRAREDNPPRSHFGWWNEASAAGGRYVQADDEDDVARRIGDKRPKSRGRRQRELREDAGCLP
ncbi:hypothetical protein B0H12DRAFT_1220337 [Mycena haematopus]|nr:hypothetical protein B0H12DRAFT_1220337 [Mycena haematopus]